MSNFEMSPPQKLVTQEQTIQQQSQIEEFVVRFWGVRGLIPAPGSDTSRYGGNTICVELCVAGKHLIFDGGTGLRNLGKKWQQLQEPIKGHLFFTNVQSNRIQGFPFFAPAFVPENSFHIYGAAATNGASIKQCLCDQMLQPHFPYPLQVMQSELYFHNLAPGGTVQLDDVIITTELINVTQRSAGYRITWQDYSVAYVTDLPTCIDKLDKDPIIRLTQGVDLLIANAAYTSNAVYNHYSSGHWQTAVDLANAVDVKRLVISYYHPDDHDDFLDQVQVELKSLFSKGLLACEGSYMPVMY